MKLTVDNSEKAYRKNKAAGMIKMFGI